MHLPPALRHPASQSLLLFLLAFLVLGPGIGAATGFTGKDEFFLGLRTPMEMIEGNHWLVPFLDGAPRIRKPPLLYWLGRAGYETAGISLITARAIAVAFAGLLVVATAGIARRLSGKPETGWLAGCILLGCLGMATEGRRFMLDVPVAALSATALWAFIQWLDFRRFFALTAAALLLAAGFLIKGPIVALVCGGGVLALLFSGRLRLQELRGRWLALSAHALLAAALALPWFFVVRLLYPEAAELMLADELESRQFFSLSPNILLGLLNIALPWVFVFFLAAWRARSQRGLPRIALLWFLITFVPFFFIKSFDRYLIGSLPALAILIAVMLPQLQARWPFRLGATLAVLFAGALAAFTFWFGLGGWYWLPLPAAYLLWAWWSPRATGHLLAAPMLLWIALMSAIFPAIGVNAVPANVVELGREKPVAMFDGPQPAMLPILSGQTHRHYGKLDRFDLEEIAVTGTPVFVEDKDLDKFRAAVDGNSFRASELGRYQTLASHGSGLRFARVGATKADWQAAFATRDLTPIMTTVFWFGISKP